jgi:hypothetical protein
MAVYASNGVFPKSWREEMKAGADSMSAAVINGSQLPDAFEKSYAKYKLMRANHSQALHDLVPKDQVDLYEAARIGEEHLGLSKDKAVATALAIAADPVAAADKGSRAAMKDVKDAASKNFDGFFPWSEGAVNKSYLSDRINDLAQWYVRMGLNSEKAIELAGERVRSSHVNVNGYYIDTSDKRLPPQFPGLVQGRLDAYAAKHGKEEGLAVGDLTVRPAGNGAGAWYIVRKSAGGIPVDHPNDRMITLNELLSDAAAAQEKGNLKTLQTIEQNSSSTNPNKILRLGEQRGWNGPLYRIYKERNQ